MTQLTNPSHPDLDHPDLARGELMNKELKSSLRNAYAQVKVSEEFRNALRAQVLADDVDVQEGIESQPRLPVPLKRAPVPLKSPPSLLKTVHNWGLGYFAAAAGLAFLYLEPAHLGGLPQTSAENSLAQAGSQMRVANPASDTHEDPVQGNKFNRFLPADFDLEGDYEALPDVVKEVIGTRLANSPRYEVKVPRKVRGQYAPGEGRFFASNKGNIGVSLELKPQAQQAGQRPKTLFVVPVDVDGQEVRQEADKSRPTAERMKSMLKWNSLMEDQPRDKTIGELVEEAEMGAVLDSRTRSASWSNGQLRYVLFDE